MNTDILQGSVLTQLRCGGTVNEDFVANLLTNLPVKNFDQSTFGDVMGNIIVACFLLTHSVQCGPMPNVMAALPNISSAICSTQSAVQ